MRQTAYPKERRYLVKVKCKAANIRTTIRPSGAFVLIRNGHLVLQGDAGPQQEACPGERSPVPPTTHSGTLVQGAVYTTICSQ